MANEDTAGTSGQAGAAGKEGSGEKKIAGKYTSVEHAVESLDKGMTEFFHSTREEMSTIRQLLERGISDGTTIGTAGRTDQGYDRDRDTGVSDDDFDTPSFLANPGRVLSAREKKYRDTLKKEVSTDVSNKISAASIVMRFQMKNPDLDEHEGLVRMFMGETDQRDQLAKRLNEAAKKTREYLSKVRGEKDGEGDHSSAGRRASDEEYVEEPTGGGERQAGKGKEKPSEEDESLADYVSERRVRRAAAFAPPKK